MISSQSSITEANNAAMRSDFEYALGQLNNHPPERRTPELLFCLMRNSEARAAMSSILGMESA